MSRMAAEVNIEPIRAAADARPRKLVGSLGGVVAVPFCASASVPSGLEREEEIPSA